MKKGFTLIELLVVIIIIVILFTIITGSYHVVMTKVNNAKCSANLKELHKALIIYANDEDRKSTDTKDMVGNSNFILSTETNIILSDYACATFSSLKCPCTTADDIGYRINENLFNNSGYAVDSTNSRIDFTELKTSNVLIYESDNSGTPVTNHGEYPLGVTIYGEVVEITDASDISNHN